MVQRPGLPPSQLLMSPDRVRPTELLQYCPLAYVAHSAVDQGPYADFSALQAQPYKVRLHVRGGDK